MVVYMLEQRWEILRQIDLQKMPILTKEKQLSFQMKLILILAGMYIRTHKLKSRRTQNESLFGADFGPEA